MQHVLVRQTKLRALDLVLKRFVSKTTEDEPRRIPDLAHRLRTLLEHGRPDRHVLPELDRRRPEPKHVRSMTFLCLLALALALIAYLLSPDWQPITVRPDADRTPVADRVAST